MYVERMTWTGKGITTADAIKMYSQGILERMTWTGKGITTYLIAEVTEKNSAGKNDLNR